MSLDYNEVFKFMKEFGVDYINSYNELIINEKNNIYVSLNDCKGIEDVIVRVVFVLCRPIAKSLNSRDSKRMLMKINDYFDINLSKEDLLKMYTHLCYSDKLEYFKDFIKRGFPIEELRGNV